MRYLVAVLLLSMMIGCTNNLLAEENIPDDIVQEESVQEAIIQIEPDRAYEVAFADNLGHVTVILKQSRGIDFIVWAKELDPEKSYEIVAAYANEEKGVLFGPEQNLQIKLGDMNGETSLQPSSEGELYVSMLNPERIFADAEEVKIIIKTTDQQVVAKSLSFKLQTKEGKAGDG